MTQVEESLRRDLAGGCSCLNVYGLVVAEWLPLHVAGTLMTPETDVLVLSLRICDPAALHGRQD